MTSALAGVRSTAEAVQVIVERCIPAMGARSGCIALIEERALALRVEGIFGEVSDYRTGQSLTLDSSCLMCRAVRGGATLAAGEHGSVVAAPLRVAGRLVGAVELNFERGGNGRELLGAATTLWALALSRARTHEAERAARASLREATNRLSFLADSSRTLNESMELGETLERLALLSVPHLGDICAIHLLRAGIPHLTASAHNWPETSERARTWLRGADGLAHSEALRAVVDDGVSVVVRLDAPADAARLATGEEALAALRALRLAAVAIVPLSVHGRVLGTMTLATGTQRTGGPDLVLAEEIGIRAGTAIERAQLYQEQSRAISQLQASLLPPELPRVAGLELATAFVPASLSGDVGGDFYDAFLLRDGRLVFVIGDVQGKGLPAAATTGLVRQSVRAAAVSATRPSDIVAHVNAVLLAAHAAAGEPHQLCTLCVLMVETAGMAGAAGQADAVGRLDAVGGVGAVGEVGAVGGADVRDGIDVSLTCAGHPLPLVLPLEGPVTRTGHSELLVGAFEDAAWTDTETHLAPGEALLCVTDGVTERRADGRFLEDELDDLVLSARGEPAAELVELVRSKAMDFAETRPTDDMAMLAMRVRARGAGPGHQD